MSKEPLITQAEAARRLGITPQAVQGRIGGGSIDVKRAPMPGAPSRIVRLVIWTPALEAEAQRRKEKAQ